MGSVYQAVRVDDLYRKVVAIKIIRRGVAGDYAIRHFDTERQSWRTWIIPPSPSCWMAEPRRTAARSS